MHLTQTEICSSAAIDPYGNLVRLKAMSIIDASDRMLGSRTPYLCARPKQFQRLSFVIENC